MKQSLPFTLCCLLIALFAGGPLFSQDTRVEIQILDPVVGNKANRSIDFRLKINKEGEALQNLEAGDIDVVEDGTPMSIITLERSETEPGIYLLQTRSETMFYTGEPHQLTVLWKEAPNESNAELKFSLGSLVVPFPSPRQFSWLDIAVLGLLVISLLLFLLSEGIAWYKRLFFKRKYVKPYHAVKIPRITKSDPMTGDPFRDDELVVVRCRTMTSLPTWKFNKHRCMNYPDCMYASDPCYDGETFTGYDKFFSQKGVYKKLNWLWLGGLGGVFAGLLWTGVKTELPMNLSQSLLGLALGLGLATALAWAEERGQGRTFSWGRVALRGIIGAILGLGLFYLGGLLSAQLGQGYGFQLIIWLLFGVSLGFVLSIRSSIMALRGILAGLVGSLVGFNLYYFLLFWFQNDSMAIVLSLIGFGAIMAIIMVTVINRLEDFELEVLSPAEFRRSIPISKWLKQQIDVFIGTDLSNYVCVKWSDDSVIDKHVQLSFDKDRVFIQPKAETLLNGRRIPNDKKIPLNNGDVIQLGRESISRMLYREKR